MRSRRGPSIELAALVLLAVLEPDLSVGPCQRKLVSPVARLRRQLQERKDLSALELSGQKVGVLNRPY